MAAVADNVDVADAVDSDLLFRSAAPAARVLLLLQLQYQTASKVRCK